MKLILNNKEAEIISLLSFSAQANLEDPAIDYDINGELASDTPYLTQYFNGPIAALAVISDDNVELFERDNANIVLNTYQTNITDEGYRGYIGFTIYASNNEEEAE